MGTPNIGVIPLWDVDIGISHRLQMYLNGIESAGGRCTIFPKYYDRDSIVRQCGGVDGILFTGGVDLSPGLYGEEKDAQCGSIQKDRDELELLVFKEAVLNMDKPAFGICRGIQLINVALGGSLYQDLPTRFKGSVTVCHDQKNLNDEYSHIVAIEAGSPLRALTETDSLYVNSYHHQGIHKLAPSLERMASSKDGLTEAVYMPGKKFVWAVQWHPERTLHDAASRKLFESFVQTAHK